MGAFKTQLIRQLHKLQIILPSYGGKRRVISLFTSPPPSLPHPVGGTHCLKLLDIKFFNRLQSKISYANNRLVV